MKTGMKTGLKTGLRIGTSMSEHQAPVSGWAMLACPHCGAKRGEPVESPLIREGRRCLCPAGHTFDVAKQGYVSLLSGRGRHGLIADSAEMVAARSEVQGAGLYALIRDGVVEQALAVSGSDLRSDTGGVLDVGGGTGYYAGAVLDALPTQTDLTPYGVTFDLSAAAARRAAKAHPRLVSVVADVWQRFPIRTGSVAVALVVFAPRNTAELARVLSGGGVAVVVTPLPQHLAELSSAMITVDPDKRERLDRQFERFDLLTEREVVAPVQVTARQASAIVGMGPSAHHSRDDAGYPVGGLTDETREVTLAVRVATYRPAARSLATR